MAAAETPLTGVAWAAAPEALPAGWTAITVTVEGAAANLGKGFGHKSGGYLCVSTGGGQVRGWGARTGTGRAGAASPEAGTPGPGMPAPGTHTHTPRDLGYQFRSQTLETGVSPGRGDTGDGDASPGWGHRRFYARSGTELRPVQAAAGLVVTDVVVLSDRSPQPPGYTRAPEFPEPRTGISRKKRLYVKLSPVDAAETAVVDVQLSAKSKALPQYMKIGEMGNFAIWCKKGPVLKRSPPPVPKPRSISAGLRHLSLQSSDSDQKSPPARCSIKRAAQHEALYDASNIYGLSAMDGVPFTLHPKFESKLSSGSNAILADLNVKSLADIEKEYNYAFVVERTAAARLPPGVC